MSDIDDLLGQLVRSGLMSEDEARVLIAKKGAREFGAMAIKTIIDLSPWSVQHVVIKTESWTVTWEEGQMTVTPVKPRSRTIGNTSQAASKGNAEGIPADVWKDACERAGVRYYGPRASARNGRVRAIAIELAKSKGLIA